MALKTILVAASGGSANDGAIETACRIAGRTGARVEAFHVQVDPRQIIAMMGDGAAMPLSGEWFDRLMDDAEALAAKIKAGFEAAAQRHGLGPAAVWRTEAGYAPILVARRARFFDLVVLGRSDRVVEHPHTDTIEETLIRSGRPVLLAPAKAPDKIGETVALGWNGSPQAVHAVAQSLTLLERAASVIVITVGEQEGEDTDVAALLDYLLLHGVKAKHVNTLPVKGVGPGEQLLAEARDQGADLLVMGGYGHGPWRETLFGGATRQIVGASLLPVLLAH